tara:strand:- start:169 stop:1389 length:1221 start_codon:yes stop_codon:yes gene_type:complete
MVVQNQRNSVAIKLLYIFFLLPFIINYIIGDKSSSHIISGAFSVRNYSEILCFMILSLYIISKRKYLFDNLIDHDLFKPFFYVSILYLASTIWSEYRLLTLFRSLEFVIISLVAFIAFNNKVNTENFDYDRMIIIRDYVVHLSIIGILYGFFHKASYSDNLLALHLPKGNLIANILGGGLIVFIYSYFVEKHKSFYLIIIPIFFYISFSLSAFVNIFSSLAYIYLSFKFKKLKNFFIFFILSITASHFFLLQLDFINQLLSTISSRSISDVQNLTGRTHIWTLIFMEMKNYKIGAGFATDLFILKDQYFDNVISTLSSAHSIYVETYITAKWVGIFILIYSFYFWFKKSQIHFNVKQSYLIQGLVLYVALCGFTNSGFGGSVVSHPFTYFWIVIAGNLRIVNKKNE